MKKVTEKIATIGQTIYQLVVLFRRSNSHFLQYYIGMMSIIGVISFLQPILSGLIVVHLNAKHALHPIILFAVQLLMTLALGVTSNRIGDLLEHAVKIDLQRDYACSLISNPIGLTKGELLTSFHADTSTVAHLGRQIISFFSNVVISIVSGLGLILFSPIVFLLGICGVILIVFVNYQMNRRISSFSLKKHYLYAQYSEKLNNVASAYEELKVQNMYCNVVRELNDQQDFLKRNDVLCNVRIESPGRFLDFILGVVPVAGYTVGAFLFREDTKKLGLIVTTTAYLTNFLSKSSFWAYLAVLSEPLKQSIERINNVLVNVAPQVDSQCSISTAHIIGSIKVHNISFAYTEGNNVIENMSFVLPATGLIAFSGKSGSGKSTVMKVLLKALNPTKGQILVNETDLCDIEKDKWQAVTGYLYQGGTLFSGTIRDNILLFNESPDFSFVDLIASSLSIKKELGDKYLDIVVTEGSGGISTGQKDRIRLLCVLSRRPQILFLDEPGANLDEQNLVNLYDCLVSLSKKMLIICAAHDHVLNQFCDLTINFD